MAAVSIASPQGSRTFTGTVTDSECALANHAKMQMGANDAECTIACADAHGAQFVLFDGKNTYILNDQKTPEKYAGRRVTVTGALKPGTMTIQVEAIAVAK
jgi:hypothetical protein